MSLIVPTILANRRRPHHPFVILQSSLAQSAIPIFRRLLSSHSEHNSTVLLCTLYPPRVFLPETDDSTTHVIDWTEHVPGYRNLSWEHRVAQVSKAIDDAPRGPVTFAIDHADTLNDDLESPARAYRLISLIFNRLRDRADNSRLAIHITAQTPLLPLLTQVAFSPTLAHFTAHPPVLLTYLSTAYLTPPPSHPGHQPVRFWRAFVPVAERTHDIERLVFGAEGEGGSGGAAGDDIVVELLLRGRGSDAPLHASVAQAHAYGQTRKRGVERVLEGWSAAKGGSCALKELESLKRLWSRGVVVEQAAPDPTRDLPFNLTLTSTQQESRARVPLPYAHEGNPPEAQSKSGRIYYDPDSADDLDDEDPDEDLDI